MARHFKTPFRGTHYNLAHPMAYLDASLRLACLESGLVAPSRIAAIAKVSNSIARSWWHGKKPMSTGLMTGLLAHFNLHVIPVPPESLPPMPLQVDSMLELCLGERQ